MIILPAIDIRGGECVRLYKGDFATTEKVADNPLATAKSFEAAGATWIHMVDLDGAKSGKQVNNSIFIEVAKNTGLKVELGGGIRNMDTVDYYLQNGISRVILGSAAVSSPNFVKTAVAQYGEKIAVGIDARDGFISVEGWLENSTVNYVDFAKEMERVGVQTIIYTDISKDGTLTGPSVDHYRQLTTAVSCDIIASGGIKDISDIKALRELGLYGAICGKSIYKATLDLAEAIQVASK